MRGIANERTAQQHAKLQQHALRRVNVFMHQNRNAVERIEKKVRV